MYFVFCEVVNHSFCTAINCNLYKAADKREMVLTHTSSFCARSSCSVLFKPTGLVQIGYTGMRTILSSWMYTWKLSRVVGVPKVVGPLREKR